ncbi:MAG: hypothetical protein A2020_15830 [Lentisphaerae bacterium GWF2_45_14]|nr:MAG: hypothetical protein A2020_15830 [Lentisphaerae bacterium GWF2_45_14]
MANESSQDIKGEKKYRSMFLWGCVMPLFLMLGLCVVLAIWFAVKSPVPDVPPDYIKNAEQPIKDKLSQLEERRKALEKEKKKSYDIDRTVQAFYSMEKTIAEAKNFKDLTTFIMQKESDKIPPEVAELKYRFFNIYKNLLEESDSLDETNSIYNLASGTLLDLLSTFDYGLLSINNEQARKIWDKRINENDLRTNIRKRLSKHRAALLDFYTNFLRLSAKYYREWDKLCSLRDRAYLAIYENDWNEAIKSASAAVELAPHEKEAHILLAMSLLERKGETDVSAADSIISEYIEKHNGQEAPAHLLKGVINMKQKKFDQAVIDFDQAAAYYPKQQEELLDLLNLYKKRSFLNKSKEGRVIINLYRGIMTGSGYFSPDFQKARVHMARGEKDMARKKIFDHFFRRRLQGQWDKVLADFRYSNNFLETELLEINASDLKGKISLQIEPAFFTNSVIVTVRNEGSSDIHNMTILLCVRFTDMFKGDYVSFPVGDTVALLKAGESITVGRRNISAVTQENLGSPRKFKDIIDYAAVLISDELISWVESKTAPQIKEPGPMEKTKNMAIELVNNLIESMSSAGTREDEKKKQKEMAEAVINTLTEISQSLKNKDSSASTENLKLIADELSKKAAEYISEKGAGKSKTSQQELKAVLDSVMKEAMEKAGKKPEKDKK